MAVHNPGLLVAACVWAAAMWIICWFEWKATCRIREQVPDLPQPYFIAVGAFSVALAFVMLASRAIFGS